MPPKRASAIRRGRPMPDSVLHRHGGVSALYENRTGNEKTLPAGRRPAGPCMLQAADVTPIQKDHAMSLLPGLFDICTPREDILQGTLTEADYAADLAQVLKGTAPREYQDPAVFFFHDPSHAGPVQPAVERMPASWGKERPGGLYLPSGYQLWWW